MLDSSRIRRQPPVAEFAPAFPEDEPEAALDLLRSAIAIGCERTLQIAREMRAQIEYTDRWMEELGKSFKTPLDFLQNNADAWDQLYLNAYLVFDSPKYVAWFGAKGFDGAIHVGNGESALEQVEYIRPDLILLDVMMPGMDGPATLKALRLLPAATTTPVIFMTARVQAQEVVLYRELGAAEVIAKPFDPMALAATVREIWSSLP
jgi:CheY-like chemotaxis protein